MAHECRGGGRSEVWNRYMRAGCQGVAFGWPKCIVGRGMPPGLFRGVQCQHLVLSHSLSAERHQSCRGSWCSAPTQWFDASLWFNILLECSIVDEAGYHAVQRVLPLPRRRTCGGASSLRSQNLLPGKASERRRGGDCLPHQSEASNRQLEELPHSSTRKPASSLFSRVT